MTEYILGVNMTENKDSLDLDSLKETMTWDSLIDIHKDALEDIGSQLALVDELRTQYKDTLTDDLKQAFEGLTLSFKDLIKETVTAGLTHAENTKTITRPDDDDLVFATSFYTGDIVDDDQAMTYLNTASQYLGIQDKTANLIALGWVDLFVQLKIPTDALNVIVDDALAKQGE